MFGKSEQKLIDILGKKKMTTREIHDHFYEDEKKPIHSLVRIIGIIRTINAKCEAFNLKWSLVGEGSGRKGTTWESKRRGNK